VVNDTYHALILRIAGNKVLTQSLPLTRNIPYLSSRVVHWYKGNDAEGLNHLRSFHAQHHAIFLAICTRDGYSAENVMRCHIVLGSQQIQVCAPPARQRGAGRAGRNRPTPRDAQTHG
jgi:DNA-binding GntR family transcriptional regulator